MEIIQESGQVFLVIAIIFGFYMTWGIGANDVANAMGTSVGSGAITVKQAILIAAVFEFAGAFIAGGAVTKTIRKGIIDPSSIVNNPEILVYGMLGALLGAAIWLMIASSRGWPVSTTHSIVGALVGFAMVGISPDAVKWVKIGKIVVSWLASPLIGAVIGFVLMMSVRQFILNAEKPLEKAKTLGPFYVFLVGWIVILVSMFKGLKHLKLSFTTQESFMIATVGGIIVAIIGKILISRVDFSGTDDSTDSQYAAVEKVFKPMMIFTACAMAFAHGSNDVANGIGPLAAVVSIIDSGGQVAQKASLPLWVLVLGGAGIVVGLATMGYKVMATIGTKITELTPTRGFCATLAAATTVVLASKTGIPVSTTHIAVGGVMGVGLARGIGALDFRVLGGIVVSWIVTLPAAGFMSAITFFVLKGIFGGGVIVAAG